MPIYEYCCEACKDGGVFEALMPLADYKSSAPCPSCGKDSPRIMSVPLVPVLSSATRKGMQRNERAQNEPYRYSDYADPSSMPKKKETLQQSSGARPWMMG